MPISHWWKLAGMAGARPPSRQRTASIPSAGQATSVCSSWVWSFSFLLEVSEHSLVCQAHIPQGLAHSELQLLTPQKSWGEEGHSQHVWPQADGPCRMGQFSASYQAAPSAVSNSGNILAICKSCLKCQTIHCCEGSIPLITFILFAGIICSQMIIYRLKESKSNNFTSYLSITSPVFVAAQNSSDCINHTGCCTIVLLARSLC